jgi:THO complex subunit 2
MFYKQQKYNLFREEGEGYSKLLIEIVRSFPPTLDKCWVRGTDPSIRRAEEIKRLVARLLENIKSLIGYFDLDPNRVLDVILDAFLINVFEYWDFFVALLLASPWSEEKLVQKSIVATVLGFKFRYYTLPEAKWTLPIQLLWIAAIMIKHGIVELDALYPHLSPSDEEISGKLWDEHEEKMKSEADTMRSGDNVCFDF